MKGLDAIPIPEWSPEGLADYYSEHGSYFLVLSLIGICLLTSIYLVLSVIVKQTIKRREEARRTVLKAEVENLLSSFLTDNTAEELNADIIWGWARRSRQHELIICQVFLELFGMLSGSAREILFRLYTISGIKEKVVAGLSRRNNPHIFLYVDLASKSNTSEARQGFKNLLKHPEREIRFQALCSLVEVFGFNALDYILENEVEINEWEEMILMEKLLTLPGRSAIPMKEYLSSGNDSLIRITLRMAQHFNRYDVEEELPDLLGHPSAIIRQRIFELSGPLLLNGLQELFIRLYPEESLNNKRSILQSLSQMGDQNAIPFLRSVFLSKTSELSLAAGAALFAIAGEEIVRNAAGNDDTLLRMCLHIEDPALK